MSVMYTYIIYRLPLHARVLSIDGVLYIMEISCLWPPDDEDGVGRRFEPPPKQLDFAFAVEKAPICD